MSVEAVIFVGMYHLEEYFMCSNNVYMQKMVNKMFHIKKYVHVTNTNN